MSLDPFLQDAGAAVIRPKRINTVHATTMNTNHLFRHCPRIPNAQNLVLALSVAWTGKLSQLNFLIFKAFIIKLNISSSQIAIMALTSSRNHKNAFLGNFTKADKPAVSNSEDPANSIATTRKFKICERSEKQVICICKSVRQYD